MKKWLHAKQLDRSLKFLEHESGKESKKQETLIGTNASLFSALYSFLLKRKQIKFPKNFVAEIDKFEKDDLIEVEGNIRPSGAEYVMKTLSNILFSPLGQMVINRSRISAKQRSALSLLQGFPQNTEQEEQTIIKFYPIEDSDFIIVLKLDTRFLREGINIKDIYNKDFKVFFRLTKILSREEKYDMSVCKLDSMTFFSKALV